MYMKQSSNFEDTHRPHLVCKLQKTLYDLKKAPRSWYQKLSLVLFSLDFVNSITNPSVFYRKSDTKLTIMLIYVDDILLT